MSANWPKWAEMNWLRLLEGPADLTVIDIAPTMKNVTVRGETYNRMRDSRAPRPGDDTTARTEYGGSYLWDGWLPQKLASLTPTP